MKPYFIILGSLVILFALLSLKCSNSKSVTTGSAPVSLTGEWVVVAQTSSPLVIAPLCKLIRHGTTFKFTQNTLELYIDASGKPCNVYLFKITANTISFIKEDMIWLCRYELKPNNLKIISNNFFTSDESHKSIPLNNQPATMPEIVVTLTKRNN